MHQVSTYVLNGALHTVNIVLQLFQQDLHRGSHWALCQLHRSEFSALLWNIETPVHPLIQYMLSSPCVNSLIQGSHPTWKTWNFVICFSRPGKYLEFAHKLGKTWNFNSKPGKKIEISKFDVSRFTSQDVIYKKYSFTSFSYLHYEHKLCDLKPNWPEISLLLPGKNLDNSWNFVSPEKWETWNRYYFL